MDYALWFRVQKERGTSFESIAKAALHGPLSIAADGIAVVVQQAAAILHVSAGDIHIVGSSRYGFSLHDGARFDPVFSDLDLAVVDTGLHRRCASSNEGARYPELELPIADRIKVRDAFEALSQSVAHRFSYVSTAVFPNLKTLLEAQAKRISAFLQAREAGVSRSGGEVDLNGTDGPSFPAIVGAGTPQYMQPIAASNPFNASPWVTDAEGFANAFSNSAVRRSRLAALERALGQLRGLVEVECCLVGGSFVDAANPVPKDVDIVVLYRARAQPRYDLGRGLQRLTRRFLLDGIDMRLVPCDASPWLVVKLVSFFTMLYLSRRLGAEPHSRGLVLLTCEARRNNDVIE